MNLWKLDEFTVTVSENWMKANYQKLLDQINLTVGDRLFKRVSWDRVEGNIFGKVKITLQFEDATKYFIDPDRPTADLDFLETMA